MIKFELHHNLFIERSKTTTKKAIGCPKKMSCLSIKLPITNTYMIMTGNISFLLKHAPWNSLRKVLSCAGHTWVSSAFQKHFPCTASRMLHSAWFSTCALALLFMSVVSTFLNALGFSPLDSPSVFLNLGYIK